MSFPTSEKAVSRRDVLFRAANGLGSIALAWLLPQPGLAVSDGPKGRHCPAKAKRLIHIFAAGGVSHVDAFDYKSELERHHGKALSGKGEIDTFFGKPGNLLKSQWTFRRRGQSGLWMSDLMPHLAECVDDLCFIYSMTAKSSNHTPATFQMNTGFIRNGFPSMGSWVSYGLGSENQDLPTFVVLPDPRGLPAGGSINWTAGFLPASHQGVPFRTRGEPIADLATPAGVSKTRRHAEMKLLDQMNREYLDANSGDTTLEARLRSYELAARMQLSVPHTLDIRAESESTKRMYGLDNETSAAFGRNCLRARRLIERGVRMVQVWNGGAFGRPRINWDAHEDVVENHTKQAAVMDQPVAALLKDLKARGLLEDTLVVWSTEFGRTPMTQGLGTLGRDHHQHAFTCWLAGAGLKKGFGYGESDEVGYHVGRDRVTVYDFHATILHLLGLDHERLTFYHNGIQRRLTDVHGHVVKALLA